jgi:hypothetical protein
VQYQCLTRQRPFGGDTLEQQLKGHLLTAPPRPSTVNAEIGPAFDDVIAIGMAKEPDRRYGSALELAAAARDAQQDVSGVGRTAPLTHPAATQTADNPTVSVQTDPARTPVSSTGTARPSPSEPRTHRSRRRWIAAAAAVAVTACGAAGGLIWQHVEHVTADTALAHVRGAVDRYDLAVQNGNLAQLRAMTCGTARDRYQQFTPAGWARVHTAALRTKQYPINAGIDHIHIDGDTASADITQYPAATPQNRTTSIFQLQLVNGRWKICADGA